MSKIVFICCDGCGDEVGGDGNIEQVRLDSKTHGFRRAILETGGKVDYCPECLKVFAVAIKRIMY